MLSKNENGKVSVISLGADGFSGGVILIDHTKKYLAAAIGRPDSEPVLFEFDRDQYDFLKESFTNS